MSDILAFQANNNGKLQLAIHMEMAQVQTEWKNLTNPKRIAFFFFAQVSFKCLLLIHLEFLDVDEEPSADRKIDIDKIFTVHVSIRSFLKFLNCHVISKTTIACKSFLLSFSHSQVVSD